MIVATVFGLWLSVFLGDRSEAILSYVLILSFGVLHGANDIDLIGAYARKRGIKKSNFQYVIVYLLTILCIWSLFYVYPFLALIAFVLISGYHFGEQHWNKKISFAPFWKAVFYFLYGSFILFMIFYVNNEQVQVIIGEISGIKLSGQFYRFTLILLGLLLAVQWALGLLLGHLKHQFFFELFLLGIFYVIFKTSSLLLGFCIYFVIWHSVPSLLDQMKFLYGEISGKAFLKYLKSSFIYWLISVMGFFGIYLLLGSDDGFLVSALICFLAAITFPHVFIMSRLEKYLKADSKTDVGG
ncbi:beta-carotene 15,15'-dioxygenase, Brp/Blh family [Muricauda sp. JGD-17]|uniref:Probable beta-carotene 15,15'-dioxygenase n=1 Tax=Flagellimonas ochracea TaxID=2696472 RepID=A0A964TFN0_9FLAO|nr:Brp/Blh family beta-carotene 15,15'-dioxygenase [Allomuricauda ochracea]NAY92971.1 beta-carotene 15,15'-dioxygenase, Brp/Blh family [Allomuricauda ochracea]